MMEAEFPTAPKSPTNWMWCEIVILKLTCTKNQKPNY